MGVYWQTYLYYNVHDTRNTLLLSQTEQIIQYDDVKRGFYPIDELIKKFESIIYPSNITSNSYLIEFLGNSYNGPEKIETRRLPIR